MVAFFASKLRFLLCALGNSFEFRPRPLRQIPLACRCQCVLLCLRGSNQRLLRSFGNSGDFLGRVFNLFAEPPDLLLQSPSWTNKYTTVTNNARARMISRTVCRDGCAPADIFGVGFEFSFVGTIMSMLGACPHASQRDDPANRTCVPSAYRQR